MPVRCKFLFPVDLGDPISSIYLSDVGCMAGTMMGRVWLYSFTSKQETQCLTAFSDGGIRACHMEEDACWATVGSEGCRGWKKVQGKWSDQPGPAVVNFQSLDRKNTQKQNVKHVLQRGPLACVIFPTVSTKVDVTTQEYQHYEFKFFDWDPKRKLCHATSMARASSSSSARNRKLPILQEDEVLAFVSSIWSSRKIWLKWKSYHMPAVCRWQSYWGTIA